MIVQAPLQVYARMLAEKAQQQRALQRADAVEADREEDASSEDEEATGTAAAAQPSADTGEALATSALPLAKRKPSKAAPPTKVTPQVRPLRRPGPSMVRYDDSPSTADMMLCSHRHT